MSRIASSIENWKEKLIDLTRRNRLLFFRTTRSSTLKVIDPSVDEIFNKLVVEQKIWTIFYPPDLAEDDVEEEQEISTDIPEQLANTITAEEAKSLRNEHEIVCDLFNLTKLKSTLRNLYRRAKSDFDERGVRVLYLAFGMLEWKENKNSDYACSPLIVVPVELSRSSVTEPFQLKFADEEIVLNPAIQVKFKTDFSLDLPLPPDDWETRTISDYLSEIQGLVSKYDWIVKTECWLGLFSFHKLVIYQDLHANSSLIAANEIAASLAGDIKAPSGTNEPLPDIAELDQTVHPEQSYLVLDADSSQLACIEAVKKGANLVLQGPPGTGKSQTITNLIGETIADGKTVLFVSEKMAALEVVYKRLEKANLAPFCLQLHSHKANKREVVEELYQCYLSFLQPRLFMNIAESERLSDRRSKLNEYVLALHKLREPLNKTAFQILGELAQLDSITYVSLDKIPYESITQKFIDTAIELGHRLTRVWEVVVEGADFPWSSCKADSYGVETRAMFQSLLSGCFEWTIRLEDILRQISNLLNLGVPETLSKSKWILSIVNILREGPGIEECWLTTPELDPLIEEAHEYSKVSTNWHEIKLSLDKKYTEEFYLIPRESYEKFAKSVSCISESLGQSVVTDQSFTDKRHTILKFVDDLSMRLNDWIRESSSLSESLDLNIDQNISGIKKLLAISVLCSSSARPEQNWLRPTVPDQILRALPEFEKNYMLHSDLQTRLLSSYYESILDMDLEQTVAEVAEHYSTMLCWFQPNFYKLRSQLKRHHRDGQCPKGFAEDLKTARDLKILKQKIESDESRLREMLGSHFCGYDTDFVHIRAAIEVANKLLYITGGVVPGKTINQVVLGTLPSPDLCSIASRLGDSIAAWEQAVTDLSKLFSIERLPTTKLPFDQSSFSDIRKWLNEIAPSIAYVVELIDTVQKSVRLDILSTLEEISKDLKQLFDLKELELQLDKESERLHITYGHRYLGLETDWEDVLAAIDWTNRLKNCFSNTPLSSEVIKIAVSGGRAAPIADQLTISINGLEASLQKLAEQFDKADHSEIMEHRVPCKSLHHLGLQDFDHIKIVVQRLIDRLDSLENWTDYKSIAMEFDKVGLSKLFEGMIDVPSLTAEQTPKVVKRALLSAWITSLFQSDKSLKQFRGDEHIRAIEEFRELDKKHRDLSANRIIDLANKRKPQASLSQPGSEGSILSREANKKRRHLPLRKLFAQIPNLLTRIKPCLLMSPLSVSQFLDSLQLKFDLIIFDEASQIRSEDAIGAIYRGKQLVVCGDNKQLPPTSFFEQGMLEDSDISDSEEVPDEFDSILDQCESIDMPRSLLRWHYRSRHESLIAFSNHRFYSDQLVTFPAAMHEDKELGIKFVCVPEGIYDRGGRRDNQIEAERVVDLIIEHYLNNPKRSLGVIAFSVAQMNAIEDRLEQTLHLNPEFEKLFPEDRLEGFFVKNLETVQGDERDVIIFSIGYGKDKDRRLTMNFGPLNASGGQRRLNVAVTRAREKIILVSSIRASDMDISATQAPGVLALYHYLDYAERGTVALQTNNSISEGEYESPLEEDVAGVIRSLGYNVIPQVGCSGFRIDLGVIDPAEPGAFILGVECDGATYHSSYTARDRDRLREEILKQLGWKIHRIWSPDWVSKRDAEIKRLQRSIELSKQMPSTASMATPVPTPSSFINPEHALTLKRVEDNIDLKTNGIPTWAIKYKVCRITSKPKKGIEFHDVQAHPILTKMLLEVIQTEGPIHFDLAARRIADAWNLHRIGSRMVVVLHNALDWLVNRNQVSVREEFLYMRGKKLFTVRVPDPNDDRSVRNIEHIPTAELALAITSLVSDALSMPEEQVVVQIARLFGFDRLGLGIRQTLETVINGLIEANKLDNRSGRISIK